MCRSRLLSPWSVMSSNDRVIVALDFDSGVHAARLVEQLGPSATFPQLRVLALTVITSMRDENLREVGVIASVQEQVLRLAQLASQAGCHGVVASPQEARLLREVLPRGMLVVTPGTQLAGDERNDQVRTATPGEAIRAGSTHVVIGRSIARASNPATAFAAACDQVAQASAPMAP